MVRNLLMVVALFFLIEGNVSARKCGIVLYNDFGKKFKVYANGNLMNEAFMSKVKICCFPTEEVKIKVEFESGKTVSGTIFLRRDHMEYDYVNEDRIEFDHYGKMPEGYKNISTVSVMNTQEPEKVIPKNDCQGPVSNVSFYEYMRSLNAWEYDSDRLKEAKNDVNSVCFTSKQIRILLNGFVYESARLEFAKYAYNFVYDKDAYAIVKNGLTTDRSVFELDEYMKTR